MDYQRRVGGWLAFFGAMGLFSCAAEPTPPEPNLAEAASKAASCDTDCDEHCERCPFNLCYVDPACYAACSAERTYDCAIRTIADALIEPGARALSRAAREGGWTTSNCKSIGHPAIVAFVTAEASGMCAAIGVPTGGLGLAACAAAVIDLSDRVGAGLCKKLCQDHNLADCPEPPPPPPPAESWIGIGRSDGSNAIFAMDGSPSSRPEVAPWKYCPEGRVLVGASLFSAEESFWVCTTPARQRDPFFVARFVNAAAFVYSVRDGSVARMGGIEYQNCPILSSPLGRALAPGGTWGGFWACSGGGISPPPVELPSRAPVLMIPNTPSSTAQHWFFDPIGASRSRAPADLSAAHAGLMLVNRRTGMTLDHSGTTIGPYWIAILERNVWGAKGQVWLLEKHPTLDRYVIRWPATGHVLDYATGEDGRRHAILHDEVRGAPAQLWELRRVDGDYYSIINHHSGEALDF